MRSALILIASVVLVAGCVSDAPAVAPLAESRNESSPRLSEDFANLRAELERSVQFEGVSPEYYDDVGSRINSFAQKGYEVAELMQLLSMLRVGGGEVPSQQIDNQSNQQPENQPQEPKVVIWHNMENGAWVPRGNPPDCPELVFQSPVDLSIVSSIIYPGQVRSGDFKPHGGFRTDDVSGPVEVTAPMAGYIWNAAKFTDEFGLHYTFDIQHPCGIMYRLGHLNAVPEKLDAIFNETKGFRDSRTFLVDPPVFVELGETIATDIQHRAGFDWGVYDLRKENAASQDPVFREAHKDEMSQAYYALCWLNMLPPEQESIVKSLPATDGISGKNSDYCK
ncbi:MAG: hypothetical protein J4400_03580 [Candidatus Aenigmarchaeota archaeon]|nr:hypothetical protein [Candidatus Aenigmarchaeota archaeon]